MKKSLAYGLCAAIAVPAAVYAYEWIKNKTCDRTARRQVGEVIKDQMKDRVSDICVLVKVTPWGKAEQQFMNDFGHIRRTLKVVKHGVMLNELFGYTNSSGSPVAVYTLEFETDEDADKAATWLNEYFYNIVTHDESFDDPADPEVVYSRKTPNKVEESIRLARETGVPEDKILHSEEELKCFLCDI